MVDVSKIGWGKYRQYEGPMYLGQHLMPTVGPSASTNQKYMSVIAATEGGRFDAINMYDRMIISAGFIQWGEAGMFGVSALLGYVKEAFPEVMKDFEHHCCEEHVELVKQKVSGPNKWRFVHDLTGEVVDTVAEQRKLFLNNSDGTIGSWKNEDKEHARKWAAAVASVFEHPDAQQAQIDFTSARLMGFLMPSAQFLFKGVPDNEWHAAARAAYLSFAANLPAVAAKHLEKFLEECTSSFASPQWVIHMLKELTFGPGILIYPARYNAIRPVLERLYGINLPNFADELAKIKENESNFEAYTDLAVVGGLQRYGNLMTPKGVQQALIVLGYDLGPKGADGVVGPKTMKAIKEFQAANHLVADGIVGPRTRAVLIVRLKEM